MSASKSIKVLPLLLVFALIACGEPTESESLSSARAAMSKSDGKAAMVHIKAALQLNARSPEARLMLGQLLLEAGRAESAEVELRKALEFKPDLASARPALARSMVFQKKYQKVLDEFEKFESTDPGAKADVLVSLAKSRAGLGQFDVARQLVSQALVLQPNYIPAMLTGARLAAIDGGLEAGLKLIDSSLQAEPKNAEAWLLRADFLLYGRRDLVEAEKAYRKVLELLPQSDSAVYLTASSAIISMALQRGDTATAKQQFAPMQRSAATHPQTRFLEAQISAADGNFVRARELLGHVIKIAPDDVRVLLFLGIVEFQLNAPVQAQRHLGKAVSIAPALTLPRQWLARTYLRNGQSDKAKEALAPLLSAKPVDAVTLSIAADANIAAGDFGAAEQLYVAAMKINPNDVNAKSALALLQLARGQSEAAFAELGKVAQTDTSTIADLALFSAHMRAGNLDRALIALDGLDRKQPNSALPKQLRAQVLIRKLDHAGARSALEQALARDAMYFPAVASMAALDMIERKPEEAKKRFEAVLAKDPKHLPALTALAEFAARQGASPDQVASWLTRAVEAQPLEVTPRLMLIQLWLLAGDSKTAMQVAQAAAAAFPNDSDVMDLLGRAQLAAGNPNQAILTFSKLASNLPNAPIPHMRMAHAYGLGNNPDMAVRELRRVLEIDPNYTFAQRELMFLAAQKGQWEPALKLARDIQRQQPKAAAGFYLEGEIQSVVKKWEPAVAAFRAGLEKEGASRIAPRLHRALVLSGRGTEADRFATDWLKTHSTDVDFYLYLGDSAMAKPDLVAAEQRFNEVLKVAANHPRATNNVAWLMANRKSPDAVKMAQRAVQLAPSSADALDTLAFALAQENSLAKAVEAAQGAVDLKPQDPYLRLSLAKLLLKAGDKAKAKTELEGIAKLGAKFRGQAEVQELLLKSN